jgi:hypothetical protein
MTRTLIGVSLCAFFAVLAAGQYGTAPNNYYPDQYNGSTFTGVLTETKDDKITLTYTKGGKTDLFTGRFEAGCSVPTADKSHPKMTPSDIPKGTAMTAFFNTSTKKIEQQKVKENVVLAIAFNVWQGQQISEDKRRIYLCTNDRHLRFKAWGN